MELNKKAFTLTELLIALGVIGILAAILLPVISNLLPDQNVIMAKRAYYAVQNVVSDMINNADCYPDKSRSSFSDHGKHFKRIGFDDGFRYPNCSDWLAQDSDYRGADAETPYKQGDPIERDARIKFNKIFYLSLDKAQDSVEPDFSSDSPSISFATKDGMHWGIMQYHSSEENFNGSGDVCDNPNTEEKEGYKCNPEAYARIFVDVNGASEPNRMQPRDGADSLQIITAVKNQTEGTQKTRTSGSSYDVFEMRVYADGRIEVMDSWAKKAIDASQDVLDSSHLYDDEYTP